MTHSKVINGSISMLQKLRPKDHQTDILFVGTERFEHFTLAWNPALGQLDTLETFVDSGAHHMRDSLSHDKCLVDPDGRYLAMHLWEGVMTIMRLKTLRSKVQDLEWMAQVRLSELFVLASTFLYTETGHPKIALLYKSRADAADAKLATYRLTADDSNREASRFDAAREREMDMDVADPAATMLIPVRKVQEEVKRHNFRNVESAKAHLGGLIVVGETRLQYIDEVTKRKVQSSLDRACIFVAWAEYDPTHYLLADDYGALHLLSILTEGVEVRGMQVRPVGTTSRASGLVYLGGDLLFVPSHYGDSQLVQLDLSDRKKPKLQVLQTLSNIGPILDFAVMDMGNRENDSSLGNEYSSGQARIVTGSGVYKDGSLRSVRSGVGLEDVGLLGEIPHTRGLFSLTSDGSSKVDTLAVSSLAETRIFRFDPGGEVEEVSAYGGMILDQQTLLAKNLPGGRLLQVTAIAASLIDGDSGIVLSTWSPAGGKTITNASANEKWLLLSVEGTTLVSLTLGDILQTVHEKNVGSNNEIACVHAAPQFPDIGVVGFWASGTVSIVRLHSLEPITGQTLRRTKEDSSIPRDLALVQMLAPDSSGPTLFIAMEDGDVVTFRVAADFSLSGRKSVILGTREARFHLLPQSSGVYNIFATTNHPSLIYGAENRIVYSAVTAEEAACICPFDAEAFPDCIVVATDSEMKISRIDNKRRTHVNPLQMGETIRRIAHSPREKVFGLGCIKREVTHNEEIVKSSFLLVDEVLFDRVGKEFPLGLPGVTELVEAVICAEMRDAYGAPAERFFVGTSFLPDPNMGTDVVTRGRILVFGIDRERNPYLVFAQDLKGGCRCLAVMGNNRIVAALTKTVVVSEYKEEYTTSGKLTWIASYRPSSYPVSIAVHGKQIAVADLTRSVSLVEVDLGPPAKMVEVARHFQSAWSTAVCHIGGDSYLEADGEGNLQVLRRNVDGVTEENRRRLELTSEMNLGEMVNQIRPISVETSPGALIIPRAFLGTVRGAFAAWTRLCLTVVACVGRRQHLHVRDSCVPCPGAAAHLSDEAGE